MFKHAYADLQGYVELAAYAFRRLPLLGREPYRRRFVHALLETARLGLGDIGVRSAGLGTLIIVYVMSMLAADAAAAVRLLVTIVVREVGPLLAALILLIRVGSVTAARMALAGPHGDVRRLQWLGVPPRDFLVVPSMFGIACGTLVLTLYFQMIAVGGGIALSALVLDLPMRVLFEHLATTLTPFDLGYTVVKSFLFGLAIATVTTYYGARAAAQGEGAMPELMSRAIMQSLFVMMLFNAVLGYLVYGVLLFGIVRAPS